MGVVFFLLWTQLGAVNAAMRVNAITTSPPTEPAGATINYQVVVENVGPDDTTAGALLTLTPSQAVSTTSWTCTPSVGAVCPAASGSNVSSIGYGTMVAGGKATYLVQVALNPADAGIFDFAAHIDLPAGVTDNTTADNDASVAITIVSADVDLAVALADTSGASAAGETQEYTVVVNKTGQPCGAGTTLTQDFTAALTHVTWTCAGAACPAASGMGAPGPLGAMASDTQVTFVFRGTLSPDASMISGHVSVAPPTGDTDTDGSNDSAVASRAVQTVTALSAHIDDATAFAVRGTVLSYTVTIHNAGPSAVSSGTLTCTFTPPLSAVTGNITSLGTVPPGGDFVYTVSGTLPRDASGAIVAAIEASTTNATATASDSDNIAPDTDDDGLTDIDEVMGGSDPFDADTDDDGVPDGAEVSPFEDSDGDGLINARDSDSDADGLTDGLELGLVGDADPASHTLMTVADSDHDGVSDGSEDSNHNGRVDAGETDPNVFDAPAAAPSEPTAPLAAVEDNPDANGDGFRDDIHLAGGGVGRGCASTACVSPWFFLLAAFGLKRRARCDRNG